MIARFKSRQRHSIALEYLKHKQGIAALVNEMNGRISGGRSRKQMGWQPERSLCLSCFLLAHRSCVGVGAALQYTPEYQYQHTPSRFVSLYPEPHAELFDNLFACARVLYNAMVRHRFVEISMGRYITGKMKGTSQKRVHPLLLE